jgi:RNA polymerase sigma-70 factor (ECF subfamily)
VLAAERRCELLAALDRLREEDRFVLACRFLLDLSERETAQVLNLRLGTVKSRVSRALSRLGHEIGAEAP